MPGSTAQNVLRFGPFSLDADRRVLLCEGRPVQLTPKQFDTLEYMVRNPGRILSKEEMLKQLWPDSFVEESNLSQNVFWLRKTMRQEGVESGYIVTVPGKGYRFTGEVSTGEPEIERAQPMAAVAATARRGVSLPPWVWLGASAGAVILLAAGFSLKARRPVAAATDGSTDTKRQIVLTPLINTTGDAAITGPLTSMLRVGLAQSPYLVPMTNHQITETLQAMKRRTNVPLTPEVAAEVCRRHHATAVVVGTVAQVGSVYEMTLEASDCVTGHVFSSGHAEAAKQNDLLHAWGGMLPGLRTELGESKSSVQQFSIPIEQATTGSLDAFEAFSAGDDLQLHGQQTPSVPFYKKAIELDPNFAMAYAHLGGAYAGMGEREQAAIYFTRAYELRGSTTPRERMYIEGIYVTRVQSDLEASLANAQQLRALYPLDVANWQGCEDILTQLGRFEEAIQLGEEGLRRYPWDAVQHITLVRAYLRAGRFDALKEVADDSVKQRMDGWDIHEMLWYRAVLVGDAAAAAAERSWVKGQPDEYQALDDEAFLNLRRGRVMDAEATQREFIRVAKKESMSGYADTDVGNFTFALEAMGLHRNADALIHRWQASAPTPEIAVGLAAVGDVKAAQALASKLEQARPKDTLLVRWSLPVMRAELAMREPGTAGGEHALNALEPASALTVRDFYAPYARGKAYIRANEPEKARIEFGRIRDTPGGDPFSPFYPLALLELARLQVQVKEIAAGRESYERLLSIWREADPSFSLAAQARSELAALQ